MRGKFVLDHLNVLHHEPHPLRSAMSAIESQQISSSEQRTLLLVTYFRGPWTKFFACHFWCAATGRLVWSYTSRMALTTASGSSNWTYSELLGTKICFALEERVSRRACASPT